MNREGLIPFPSRRLRRERRLKEIEVEDSLKIDYLEGFMIFLQ